MFVPSEKARTPPVLSTVAGAMPVPVCWLAGLGAICRPGVEIEGELQHSYVDFGGLVNPGGIEIRADRLVWIDDAVDRLVALHQTSIRRHQRSVGGNGKISGAGVFLQTVFDQGEETRTLMAMSVGTPVASMLPCVKLPGDRADLGSHAYLHGIARAVGPDLLVEKILEVGNVGFVSDGVEIRQVVGNDGQLLRILRSSRKAVLKRMA